VLVGGAHTGGFQLHMQPLYRAARPVADEAEFSTKQNEIQLSVPRASPRSVQRGPWKVPTRPNERLVEIAVAADLPCSGEYDAALQ
jgi:hypothetical protein